MKELKVGDSFEVVEATKGDSILYENGSSGIIVKNEKFGIRAFIGIDRGDNIGWFIGHGEFKKIGKLTITKLKK